MQEIKIREILHILDTNNVKYSFFGNAEVQIKGFSSLKNYKRDTITWIKDPTNIQCNTNISEITLAVTETNSGLNFLNRIETESSKEVFFTILNHFWGKVRMTAITGNSVVKTNKIGKNVEIGDYCYIDDNVIIEDDVQIGRSVQIECPCVIGQGTVIHSGVVIGTDGFGYYKDSEGLYQKVPHFGGVRIGKNVEIGANTCIDRGTIDDTCIGDNVKIDNLCHIAHNVVIGDNSLVIALSMLGGSSCLEKGTYVAPGCLVKNQINIGKNAFIGMGAVVLKDVPQNEVVVGVPAKKLKNNT